VNVSQDVPVGGDGKQRTSEVKIESVGLIRLARIDVLEFEELSGTFGN